MTLSLPAKMARPPDAADSAAPGAQVPDIVAPRSLTPTLPVKMQPVVEDASGPDLQPPPKGSKVRPQVPQRGLAPAVTRMAQPPQDPPSAAPVHPGAAHPAALIPQAEPALPASAALAAAPPVLPPADPPPTLHPIQSQPAPRPVSQAPSQPLSQAAAPLHPQPALDHGGHGPGAGFSAHIARSVLDSGQMRAELVMDPPELGRLRFDMVTRGDQVQVTLAAERPETLDMLRRHAEALRQEFRASGLDAGALSFGQWGGNGAWGQGAEAGTPDLTGASAPDDPPIAAPDALVSPRRAAGAGLDLRL